jgi:type VI secretion system protein ImpH
MGVGAMRRTAPDDLTHAAGETAERTDARLADRATGAVGLLDDLSAHAADWEFFALGRAAEQEWPATPRIGTALDPAEERIELAHEPGVDFPRTTIARFEHGARRPVVRSQHLGLTGPMGPLPLHLTEAAVLERSGSGAAPFADFLDMISARMLQGFYRAWASGNPCAQADRPGDDAFAGFLGAASGSTSLRFVSGAERPTYDAGEGDADEGFDDWRRLAYGGHLAGLRSAAAVGDLIGHALGRPVRVDEAVGRWRPMPADARTRIGGAHGGLGTGATLGSRFFAVEWDVALRVRARSMAELDRLLPGGDIHRLLAEAAEAVLPAHLDWHALIEIDEATIEPARLGAARLGMTGWMKPSGERGVRADVRLARPTARHREHEGEMA